MPDVIKSPDDALLYCAAKAMRLAYRGFGISPLALEFWPAFVTVAVSGPAFLYVSVDVDPYYLPLAVLCMLWSMRFWKNMAPLRIDAMKEWSVDLFRIYGGRAAALRSGSAWVRYLMLSVALGLTMVSFSDVAEELKNLSIWQRCLFPLNAWSLVALAYFMSTEPPEPDDGERFQIARPA